MLLIVANYNITEHKSPKSMQLTDKQIVKITLKGDETKMYNYLRKCNINVSKLVYQLGVNGMVEKAKEMRFYERRKNDNIIPF